MKIVNSNHSTDLSDSSFESSLPKKIALDDLISSRDAYLDALNTKGPKHKITIKLKDNFFSMRECFLKQNERFISSTIHRMNLFPQNNGLKDDIFQQARLAFIKAIDYYSPEVGSNFFSYTITAIKNSVVRFLSDMSKPFHIPARSFPALPILTESYNKLKMELGREPLEKEVFEEAKKVGGKSLPKKLHIIYPLVLKNYIPIYEPPSKGSDLLVADLLQAKPSVSLEQTELEVLLEQRLKLVLDTLNERDREIMMYYYGIGTDKEYSVEELMRMYNLSRQRINIIIQRNTDIIIDNLLDSQGNTLKQHFLAPQENLTIEQILEWGELHKEKTGKYPTYLSKPVSLPKGESWLEINQSLFYGERNLPPNTTLLMLFGEEARLTRLHILRWVSAFKNTYGTLPNVDSPNDTLPAGETWKKIDLAFRNGKRGRLGRFRSLKKFLESMKNL